MIPTIIVILGALLWLMLETHWLTVRLPAAAPEPVITPHDLRRAVWILNTQGILALAGIVGPLMFLTLDLTAAFTVPDYSPVRQSISALALTSTGWIQTIGFMLMGLMIESFTAGLLLNIKRHRGFRLSVALLTFFGFGMLLLGTFHTKAVGAPSTFTSQVHTLTAYAVFGLFPIALALMLPSIKHDPRWQGMFRYTVATIVIALILGSSQLVLTENFRYFGLYERIMALNQLTWLGIFAGRLLVLSYQRHKAR
jgi:hypothetical protein